MRGIVRALLIAAFAAVSVLQAEADPRDGGARGKGPFAREFRERANDEGERARARDHREDAADKSERGPRYVQRDQDRAREGVAAGRLLPLEAVLANVGRSIPGHHIGVDGPYQQGRRWVYRIKWLTPDGRVIIVIADAETGQILGTRGGR